MPKYKHVSSGVIVASELPAHKLAPVFVPVEAAKPKTTRAKRATTKAAEAETDE